MLSSEILEDRRSSFPPSSYLWPLAQYLVFSLLEERPMGTVHGLDQLVYQNTVTVTPSPKPHSNRTPTA